MLKQQLESMIASGKRNVCVDVAQLDYLYSDAINALIVMNKRMLDVFGRLSLLSPQPPVLEILRKAGIHNILKIFMNDTELIRTSEEIAGPMQAAPASPPAVQQPQSEFDDLRSEIGSAFEPRVSSAPAEFQPQQPASPQYSGYQAPQQPEMERRPQYPPPMQQQYAPPPVGPAPRYAPPPPPLRPFEGMPQRPAAPRAYTPPPPRPAPLSSGAETRRMPSISDPAQQIRPRPQPEQPVAPAPEEDLERFEAILEKKPPRPEKPSIERFDEEFDDTPKQRSFTPILITFLILIVLGAGGYYGYITYFKGKTAKATTQIAATAPETKAITTPQVPAENGQQTAPVTPEPAVTEPAQTAEASKPAPAPAAVEETPKPVVKKRPAVVSKPRPIPRPKRQPLEEPEDVSPEPVVASAEPTPSSNIEVFDEPPPVKTARQPVRPTPPPVEPELEPEPEPEPVARPAAAPTTSEAVMATPSGSDDAASIFLSSAPPVADVYMDGKLIGKTNVMELKVLSGTHTMRFVKGDKEVTKSMTFQPGKNPSMFVPLK